MTALPVLLVGATLGLTALAILVYALVRLAGWTPDDGAPVSSARMHGLAMALIAVLAVLGACLLLQGLVEDDLGDLRVADTGNAGVTGTSGGATATEVPTTPLDPISATLTAALPALLLVGVYAVAQRTWPRPTGPVRQARLVARRTLDYVPRTLTWCVLGLGVVALAAVVLSWTTPEVRALHLYYDAGTQTRGMFTPGSRPGTTFAPWLALALALLAAATAAVTVLVARRPPLTGLSPTSDDAVRRVAVHRVLRTAAAGALAVTVVAVAAWTNGVRGQAERTAHGDLRALAGEFAAGITPTAPAVDLPAIVDVLTLGTPIAVLVALAVLLLWRPAAAREVRGAQGASRAHEGTAASR